MLIEERTLLAASHDMMHASEVGWFAARQPGLLRFLEDRLAGDGEALAMAVDLSWRVVAAFERQRGLPLRRIEAAELEIAEEEVVRESQGGLALANGCAYRQPELCRWLERAIQGPVWPIAGSELERVALVIAATISACDRVCVPVAISREAEVSAGILIV